MAFSHSSPFFLTKQAAVNVGAGDSFYHSFILKSILIPGLNIEIPFPEGYCGNDGGKCITDTGNAKLFLPQEVCSEFENHERDDDTLKNNLEINMQGKEGNDVTLRLPLDFIVDEFEQGWVECSDKITLGMPLFAYYYLVYDMGNDSIIFVDLPASSNGGGGSDSGTSINGDGGSDSPSAATHEEAALFTTGTAATGMLGLIAAVL